MNCLVLGNSVLDGTGKKLLNLLRRGTRPSAKGYRGPDRNVRVFSLRHALIAKPAPNEDADKQHPRDLWVLHEEPGSIVGFLDSILVAFVCHGLYLRDNLDGITIFQELSTNRDNSLPWQDSVNRN